MLRLFLVLNARLAHQRGRVLLSVAGIALGVALGFGVQLVNHAAVNELAAAVRAVAGTADLEVRGARTGFPDALYAKLARLPGVALASPAVDLRAGVAGTEHSLRVIGVDVLRAARMHPQLFAGLSQADRLALLEPDRVLLSAGAARALSLARGGKLSLLVGLSRVELDVAGVLPAAALPGEVALTDVATAQWRLARLGELNRVDLRLVPGVDRAAMRARIAALLPAGTFVVPVQTAAAESADPSRAYRVNMNVLALVALFTGGFLVFSAQALEVARRRGEHALLRVLGLPRHGIARLVLIEAGAVGLLGSALGLALGWGLAKLALRLTGADLGAGYFQGVSPELVFDWRMALAYLAAGSAIALAGAALPALDAARRPPARALKAGDEQAMFGSLASAWPGLALLAAGAAMSQLGPVGGLPVFGYAAIACVLLGGIALMPRLAQAAFDRLPPMRRVPAALALEQLRGAPGQAMVSLAAIVASFSLMVAMAIMVSSFRESVSDWLNQVLPADFYFRTTQTGDTAFLDPAFEREVLALPAIARAEFMRTTRIALDAGRPPVQLLARDLPQAGVVKTYPLVGPRYKPKPGDPPAAWVNEAVEAIYGYAPGKVIELPLAGANHRFVVAGVWRDYARQQGAIIIDRAVYAKLTGDARANDAALWVQPGARVEDAIRAVRALPGARELEISTPGEIRRTSLKIFDRSFAVTYAIEAVAVLVGMFGLSSSLGAIVLARRREFGMLRHLGMTRGQIGAMLVAEGGLLALLGAAAGMLVGFAIGEILIHVVNRQSFNWGMETHLPYGMLASLTAVLIALAALTAFLSGREAMGIGAVRAVREDW
jgi:putative ABC transport system permease protein